MKYLFSLLLLALTGCTIPIVTLKKAETDHFAIVEIDLESWLGSDTHGEFAYVSHIDGVWEGSYPNKKAGRAETDGSLIKYILIEPGPHDLTLVYNRNMLGVGGRAIWSGAITEKAILKPERYFIKYQLEDKFVKLWLEDSKGAEITEKRRSVISEIAPQSPTFVPIIIPMPK